MELLPEPEWIDADVQGEIAGVAGVDEEITGRLTRMLPAVTPMEKGLNDLPVSIGQAERPVASAMLGMAGACAGGSGVRWR